MKFRHLISTVLLLIVTQSSYAQWQFKSSTEGFWATAYIINSNFDEIVYQCNLGKEFLSINSSHLTYPRNFNKYHIMKVRFDQEEVSIQEEVFITDLNNKDMGRIEIENNIITWLEEFIAHDNVLIEAIYEGDSQFIKFTLQGAKQAIANAQKFCATNDN